MSAAVIVARLRAVPTVAEPWPHATLDDFFPAEVFADLVAALPGLNWDGPEGQRRRARDLPAAVTDLCHCPAVLDAISVRFELPAAKLRITLEVAWTGVSGLPAHCDRIDKLWSGQVYLVGDPKGTELYDARGNLAKMIEWAPNRLVCWTRPPKRETHAAPKSTGRFVLLYWLLRG